MGQIVKPLLAKLIISIFSQQNQLLEAIEQLLLKRFGQIDFKSPILNFNQTQYYQEEFGRDLKRKFISFKRLIKSENLWKVKIATNRLEKKFTSNGKRQVNIDPGYITQANLILASTKNFSHRLHINRGIFQEVTMLFKDKTFLPLPWTYPDYQSKEYIDIFINIRNILNSQLKQKHNEKISKLS